MEKVEIMKIRAVLYWDTIIEKPKKVVFHTWLTFYNIKKPWKKLTVHIQPCDVWAKTARTEIIHNERVGVKFDGSYEVEVDTVGFNWSHFVRHIEKVTPEALILMGGYNIKTTNCRTFVDMIIHSMMKGDGSITKNAGFKWGPRVENSWKDKPKFKYKGLIILNI